MAIFVVAGLMVAGLYGGIAARAFRAKQDTLRELRSIAPQLESIAQAPSPAGAEAIEQAMVSLAPQFKAVLPALSAGEKRLRTKGLSHSPLYADVSQLLKSLMEYGRKKSSRDSTWALQSLKDMQSAAASLRQRCDDP